MGKDTGDVLLLSASDRGHVGIPLETDLLALVPTVLTSAISSLRWNDFCSSGR